MAVEDLQEAHDYEYAEVPVGQELPQEREQRPQVGWRGLLLRLAAHLHPLFVGGQRNTCGIKGLGLEWKTEG